MNLMKGILYLRARSLYHFNFAAFLLFWRHKFFFLSQMKLGQFFHYCFAEAKFNIIYISLSRVPRSQTKRLRFIKKGPVRFIIIIRTLFSFFCSLSEYCFLNFAYNIGRDNWPVTQIVTHTKQVF
jgi:hypothetical protein